MNKPAFRFPIRFTQEESKSLLLLGIASAWCIALLAGRIVVTRSLTFAFLPWNLLLALIPCALSLLVVRARKMKVCLFLLGLWLLFFPNAPYVLTDLLHLQKRSGSPLWFDLLLLLSFGLLSLAAGFRSLSTIHQWLGGRLGGLAGWLFVLPTLLLTGFGVQLGRFERWNSWDIFTQPGPLLMEILALAGGPESMARTWAFSFGFGSTLLMGYLLFLSPRPAFPANRQEAGETPGMG